MQVEGPFGRTWSVERLGGVPLIAPARRFTYPRVVAGEEEAMARGALELMVRPAVGGSFLATCSLGFADPRALTGVWGCPAAGWMCAVAGGYAYLVDTAAPERSEQVGLRPVVEVRALEAEQLLVFAGFHAVVAWGEDGLRWQTGRLSWEGVTLGAVREGRLEGMGWEMMSDREMRFSIDLRTGEHTGGGYLR